MTWWKFALLPLLPLWAMTAWACGGDDAKESADVTIVAESTLFEPDEITIPAGEEVTVRLENRDPDEHDLQVDGLDVEVISGGASVDEHGSDEHDGDADLIAIHTQGDETEMITFIVETPGTYEFYCTITGHKEAGMVGTLTVQ